MKKEELQKVKFRGNRVKLFICFLGLFSLYFLNFLRNIVRQNLTSDNKLHVFGLDDIGIPPFGYRKYRNKNKTFLPLIVTQFNIKPVTMLLAVFT